MKVLRISNLSYQKGYHQLFSNLFFTVNSKGILRISGANGSGKTSLLQIIAGLSTADTGSVFFADEAVKSTKYQEQVFYIGHLPAIISSLTVIENLVFLTELKKPSSKTILTKALASIGLTHYENAYCSTLSAGQKKRLVMAGLFISDALIWLLDEPFNSLDSVAVKIVKQQIKNHCEKGGVCVFTTHHDVLIANQKTIEL